MSAGRWLVSAVHTQTQTAALSCVPRDLVEQQVWGMFLELVLVCVCVCDGGVYQTLMDMRSNFW